MGLKTQGTVKPQEVNRNIVKDDRKAKQLVNGKMTAH